MACTKYEISILYSEMYKTQVQWSTDVSPDEQHTVFIYSYTRTIRVETRTRKVTLIFVKFKY